MLYLFRKLLWIDAIIPKPLTEDNFMLNFVLANSGDICLLRYSQGSRW